MARRFFFSLIMISSWLFMMTAKSQSSVDYHKVTTLLLKEYGHRNWIVIADAAYPSQSAPGISTFVTGAEHLDVVSNVLGMVEEAEHVRPVIMVDKELGYLSDTDVIGIEDYQANLKSVLGNRAYESMLHEEIIQKLDEASSLVKVLILKTEMVMPYTSVFIQLDCGYWGNEDEESLRTKMKE